MIRTQETGLDRPATFKRVTSWEDTSRVCLKISERSIMEVARTFGPREGLMRICLRSTWRELRLRWMRKVHFRRRKNRAACRAYAAMRLDEFSDINGRQAWANWRTIPRNLDGLLPDRPVSVVDLCSGSGDSTAVLAYYCAPGSEVLGLELNAEFVAHARRRNYFNRRGGRADVRFGLQNVLDPFCESGGRRLPDDSIDLINASGAVGCHFDFAAVQQLAGECSRVLRCGGLALIDAGRGGAEVADLSDAFCRHGFAVLRQSRSCIFDLGRQLCLQKQT